jgi:broad specificity phosphatase PhoE
VAARAVTAVQEAQERNVGGLALVAVTHGGTSRAIIGSLLGLEHPLWSSIGPLANCCWSTLVHLDTPDGAGRWRLLAHNSSAEPGGPGGVR